MKNKIIRKLIYTLMISFVFTTVPVYAEENNEGQIGIENSSETSLANDDTVVATIVDDSYKYETFETHNIQELFLDFNVEKNEITNNDKTTKNEATEETFNKKTYYIVSGNNKAKTKEDVQKKETKKETQPEDEFIGAILLDESGKKIEIDEKILEVVNIKKETKYLKTDIYKTFIKDDEHKVYIGQKVEEALEVLGEPKTIETINDMTWYKYDVDTKIAFYAGENGIIRGLTVLNEEYKLANVLGVNDDMMEVSKFFNDFDVVFDENSIELINNDIKTRIKMTIVNKKIFSIFIQILQ